MLSYSFTITNQGTETINVEKVGIEGGCLEDWSSYDFEIDFKELSKKDVSNEVKQLVKEAKKKDKRLFSQLVHEKY